MSDVTAQDFRELAAIAAKGRSLLARRYEESLLAAAEQREQLDRVTKFLDDFNEATAHGDEQQRLQNIALLEQVATLTAEVARYQAENDRLWADQMPRAEENDRLRHQIATLTAERDKTVTVLTHERDEARAERDQLLRQDRIAQDLVDERNAALDALAAVAIERDEARVELAHAKRENDDYKIELIHLKRGR